MADDSVRISFVIPHKGREELLQRTLQSIAAQDYDHGCIEVFVATQNTYLAEGTLPRSDRLKVTILYRPESDTISRLRNAGVEHSNGEYVAFLDADVDIAPNWTKCMLAELAADPRRVLVSAVQRCDENAPAIEKIRTALSSAAPDTTVRFLPGANLFMRRTTFEAAGGFPEELVTCEDYFFTDRVHQLGQLYFTSRSGFIHLGEDKSFEQMFKKEIWRGQSNLQSIRGRSVPLSELPSLLVPVWIAFFALSALLSLLMLHFGNMVLMLILSLLPVFLYSFRLQRVARGVVPFSQILKFYLIYFPARVIGIFKGLIKSIQR
ncbi:MAG: glycosyltransferase [Pseudomonadota bacterium]